MLTPSSVRYSEYDFNQPNYTKEVFRLTPAHYLKMTHFANYRAPNNPGVSAALPTLPPFLHRENTHTLNSVKKNMHRFWSEV